MWTSGLFIVGQQQACARPPGWEGAALSSSDAVAADHRAVAAQEAEKYEVRAAKREANRLGLGLGSQARAGAGGRGARLRLHCLPTPLRAVALQLKSHAGETAMRKRSFYAYKPKACRARAAGPLSP